MFQRKQPLRHLLSCTAVLALALGTPAAADTLREALVSTYRTNPTLNAQREGLRVNDAGVAIARAGSRPQVAATVGVNRDLTRSGVLDTGRSKGPIVSGGLDLSLPIFQGGRVRNSVQAARTRVEAGRATLRAVEGDVFVQAVQAYMDVIRDRSIVELNRNQVSVLTTNLEATRDRFEIGDLTRTDVAQSEAGCRSPAPASRWRRAACSRARRCTARSSARLPASSPRRRRFRRFPPAPRKQSASRWSPTPT
jgi:outer membrane protein